MIHHLALLASSSQILGLAPTTESDLGDQPIKTEENYLLQNNAPPLSRITEVKVLLDKNCKNAKTGTYIGMACQGELLAYTNFKETALMMVDAKADIERQDEINLFAEMRKGKKYMPGKESCTGREIKKYKLARKWWNTTEQPDTLEKAKMYLSKAKSVENIYEALCFAGSARSLFSAAEPQAEMAVDIYDSIRLYQSLFQNVIANEPAQINGSKFQDYRFKLKQCPPFLNREYANEVKEMEPILPGGRNFDFREFGAMISFNPYRSLASFESIKNRVYGKKILLDVGANGFAASPKQLVDNYAALDMHFDELVMFEPDMKGMEYIPEIYRSKMNLTFHQQYVEVGSRNADNDVVSWIKAHVVRDDFFVLKYDVDERGSGPTMEWSFLADLLHSDALSLVDELYIELHFKSKNLPWKHSTHSCRQHYDIVRQLRSCGMAIHDWP